MKLTIKRGIGFQGSSSVTLTNHIKFITLVYLTIHSPLNAKKWIVSELAIRKMIYKY